jgi:hypothetical protein
MNDTGTNALTNAASTVVNAAAPAGQGYGITMPSNWLEWLGVIASVLTIVSFGLYLFEKSRRVKEVSMTAGFLHGLQSQAVANSARETTTGDEWRVLKGQLDGMLDRLHPPSKPSTVSRTMLIITVIVWIAVLIFYIISVESTGDVSTTFGTLSGVFLGFACLFSIITFFRWMHENDAL